MKKILITGANSFIGTSVETYLQENFPGEYVVDTVDMMDGSWRNKDFSGYDSVFHVAGIAHSDSGKISDEKAKLYYAVNTDLTVETAQKAKADGAKQFVFMSSAIVYGESAPIGKNRVITKDTPTSPENCYGDSKVQAENGIRPLNEDSFKVVILRPPMIYGKGSKVYAAGSTVCWMMEEATPEELRVAKEKLEAKGGKAALVLRRLA